MTNEELIRRYAAAYVDRNQDELERLRHPEWTSYWPQSGEVVRGSANDRAMMEVFPGGPPQVLPGGRFVGSEDRWAVSPLGGAYRVSGGGESWWGEWKMRYPDGSIWLTVILIELRDGKIWRETLYWPQPFEAPEWRKPFVERVGEGGGSGGQ